MLEKDPNALDQLDRRENLRPIVGAQLSAEEVWRTVFPYLLNRGAVLRGSKLGHTFTKE